MLVEGKFLTPRISDRVVRLHALVMLHFEPLLLPANQGFLDSLQCEYS